MIRQIIYAIALLPTMAAATPDRTTRVYETLFAHNATHAFILREIDDNHGSYYTKQTDMVLIARQLATGMDDQQWPLISIFDRGAEFTVYEETPQVLNLGVTDRVNPFDVVLWRGAGNILPRSFGLWGFTIDVTPERLSIVPRYEQAVLIELGPVNKRLADSIALTVQTLDPQEGYPQAGTRDDYIWLDTFLQEPCQITDVYNLATPGDPPDKWMAVKRSCGEDELHISDIIITAVPD